MDWYETVGGREFADVTVPSLLSAIVQLTESVNTLTQQVEQLNKQIQEKDAE